MNASLQLIVFAIGAALPALVLAVLSCLVLMFRRRQFIRTDLPVRLKRGQTCRIVPRIMPPGAMPLNWSSYFTFTPTMDYRADALVGYGPDATLFVQRRFL